MIEASKQQSTHNSRSLACRYPTSRMKLMIDRARPTTKYLTAFNQHYFGATYYSPINARTHL
jgi:hypothetical protein